MLSKKVKILIGILLLIVIVSIFTCVIIGCVELYLIAEIDKTSRQSDEYHKNHNGEIDNIERVSIAYFFGTAFITLIVAIMAWVGVGNVTNIMNIKENIATTKNDVEHQLKNTLKEAHDNLEEAKIYAEFSKERMNRIRYVASYIEIQTGMDLEKRIAAAQYILQDESYKRNKKYFSELLKKESKIVKAEKIIFKRDKFEEINRKLLIEILRKLSKE